MRFSDDFTNKYFSTDNIEFKNYGELNTDDTIAYNKSFDSLIDNISNLCEPVFEDIMSSLQTVNDKKAFFTYYRALKNEVLKKNYETINIYDYSSEYEDECDYVISSCNENNLTPFYNTDYTINTNVTQSLNTLIDHAAEKMSVESTDLQNLINISCAVEALTSTHEIYKDSFNHTQQCSGIHSDEKNISDTIYEAV